MDQFLNTVSLGNLSTSHGLPEWILSILTGVNSDYESGTEADLIARLATEGEFVLVKDLAQFLGFSSAVPVWKSVKTLNIHKTYLKNGALVQKSGGGARGAILVSDAARILAVLATRAIPLEMDKLLRAWLNKLDVVAAFRRAKEDFAFRLGMLARHRINLLFVDEIQSELTEVFGACGAATAAMLASRTEKDALAMILSPPDTSTWW